MNYKKLSNDVISTLEKTIKVEDIETQAKELAEAIRINDQSGKLVVIFGNGGSAADAQHFAGELICTFKNNERRAYKAIALTTDTSIITAWSNDRNFKEIFVRQIEAFGDSVGIAIGLSTSGMSSNVLLALSKANDIGAKTYLICGNKSSGKHKYIDQVINIPSNYTCTIQTVTQVIYHSICEYLE